MSLVVGLSILLNHVVGVVIHTVLVLFDPIQRTICMWGRLYVVKPLERPDLVSLGLHLLRAEHFLRQKLVIVQLFLLLLYFVLEEDELVCRA